MTGTPSMAASSMSDRQRPGLAAAGHPDADGVGDEIAGIVEDQVVGGLVRGGIVGPAQVEEAEFFEVLHSANGTTDFRGEQRAGRRSAAEATGSQRRNEETESLRKRSHAAPKAA